MSRLRSPLTLFFIMIIVIALLALFGPKEQSLGTNVRIVFMHPPPSPIFNSGNYAMIGFFVALILFTVAASYFLTRAFLKRS